MPENKINYLLEGLVMHTYGWEVFSKTINVIELIDL